MVSWTVTRVWRMTRKSGWTDLSGRKWGRRTVLEEVGTLDVGIYKDNISLRDNSTEGVRELSRQYENGLTRKPLCTYTIVGCLFSDRHRRQGNGRQTLRYTKKYKTLNELLTSSKRTFKIFSTTPSHFS